MATRRKPRAGLYLRLSRATSDEGPSDAIARQDMDLRELAKREGWNIVEIYVDDGLSGGSDRANAKRALADLRARRVDVLAVWKWDRWSRQGARAVADLVDALDATPGALFVTALDGIRSDTSTFELQASIVAAVGKAERDATIVRTKRAHRANRTAGRWTGGFVPAGYRRVAHESGRGYSLEPDPETAPHVVRAAEMLADGASVGAACRYLDESGVEPPRAAKWTKTSLVSLMTRRTLNGWLMADGDWLRDENGLPRAVFRPVLPEELSDQVRATFVERRTGPRAQARSRLLSGGLLLCGSCGERLYQAVGPKGSPVYICKSKTMGTLCEAPVSVSAYKVEAYVVDEYLRLFGALDVYRPSLDEGASRAAVLRAELANIEADISAATRERQYDRLADLGKRHAEMAERLDAIEAEPAETRWEATGETVAGRWARLSDDEARRRMLRQALPGGVSVRKGRAGLWRPDERLAGLRQAWGLSSDGEPDYLQGQLDDEVALAPRIAPELPDYLAGQVD